MKNFTGAILLAVFLLAALCSCAPGLGNNLPIGSVPVPDKREAMEVGGARVLPFRDEREQEFIARIDGRDVMPEGDIPNSVRAGLEGYLRLEGIAPRAFSVSSLSGAVEKWFVDVKPGFPVSDLSASALVRIEVTDPTGRPVLRKRFSGEASAKEVAAGEQTIAGVLGEAMGAALEQASKDAALIEAIKSGAQRISG